MVFENPLTEERLETVERQIPVLRFAHDGRMAADHRLRILQVGRAERGTATLALVAVGMFVGAMRAGAGDVAVGEELSGFLVVVLFAFFFDENVVLIECPEEVGSHFPMRIGSGSRVDVERYSEVLERFPDQAVIAIHNILRRDAFLLGAQRNGHAMFVKYIKSFNERSFHFLPSCSICVSI